MCWTNIRSAFFPVSGHHSRKREGNLSVGTAVVLRERRIGEDTVEFADLAVVKNLRVLQRIPVLNREARDVVEDHVHDADGPDGAVRVLPVEGEVVRVLALFLHILVALNQESRRSLRSGRRFHCPHGASRVCTSRRTTSPGV